MRKLSVFNNVSLDGYFTDLHGDMSWAHQQDAEWTDYTAQNAAGDVAFLFGRVTYEMMASFWPTPQARELAPAVAKAMNERQKLVFSRTLQQATWQNTRLLKGELGAEVRRLKNESKTDLLIFGSGSLVSQLAGAGLIDEYKLVLSPLVLGAGRTMFEGLEDKLRFQRTSLQSFKNGNLVASYVPAR